MDSQKLINFRGALLSSSSRGGHVQLIWESMVKRDSVTLDLMDIIKVSTLVSWELGPLLWYVIVHLW